MKRRIHLWMGVALTLLTAACQDENPVSQTHGTGCKLTLTGEIDQLYLSRVNDNGFADGDQMGVYVVDYAGGEAGTLQASGNRANNVKHTFDYENFKWTAEKDIYFRDENTPVDIYGYYPYSSATPSDVNQYAFEVQKDQQSEAGNGLMGGYEQSDFLWGKVTQVYATDRVIRLPMKHRMSNVRITLKEGDGFAEGQWEKLAKIVMIQNTVTKAVINLSTGDVTPQGEASEAGILPYESDGEWRAIVVPQTVGAGKSLFTLTVGQQSYRFMPQTATVLEPCKMNNYTITVNRKTDTGDFEFLLTDESITPWEADKASHSASLREYVTINVPQAGTLQQCIADAKYDYQKVENLKITGEINATDFYFMRDNMTKLSALNLKEVTIKKDENNYDSEDNEIPDGAFYLSGSVATLYYLVLPDKLKKIGSSAFSSQPIQGSLIIPEGVVEIGTAAFSECRNLTGTLSLPSTLKKIGAGAFGSCGFTCELKIPASVTEIGGGAFSSCSSLYGTLTLPDGLKSIENNTFDYCHNLTGDLTIPTGIKSIGAHAFFNSGFDGRLTLPEGLETIEEDAFYCCNFRGELSLPQSLKSIKTGAFGGDMYHLNGHLNYFSGTLVLPENLKELGEYAFSSCSRLSGTLKIPESITAIQTNTFYDCKSIEKLILPTTMDVIKSGAFAHLYGLGSIVCQAVNPPYVESGAFNGTAKDNFAVEVPEASVAAYRTAQGWNEFKRIVAHRELVCRPSFATALNKGHQQTLVLDAESEWEVQECPSWCHLDKTSGNKKTELTLTIDATAKGSGNREGDIIFLLKGKDYTTDCHVSQYDYTYDEDEVITLQSASKGKGVNLVFIGDGYSAKDISEGTYLTDMKQQVSDFFGVEPYTTYRDYFNVYTAIAMSQESGVGTVNTICYNKFETTFTFGVSLQCDNDAVFKYALQIPNVTKSNLNQTLIVLTPNTTDYGGVTQMWDDGSAIAITPKSADEYPYDSRGIVQHEAGGHGFGKLGDEYIYRNEFAPEEVKQTIENGHARGWYLNLSVTGKMHEVPWSHLIFHDKYSAVVDVYEGGCMYTRSVFRSELNSCMNNNIPYFSTISREAIVRRIMQYAGETYTFDKFVANDNMNTGSTSRSGYEVAPWNKLSGKPAQNHHEPIIHSGKPKI